ncbi:1ff2c0ca-34e3-40fb-903d-6a9bbf154403 [Thermothielavioides terrestris]|uniref:1ff2c0ca-34e3-40fb-903d-6a9bbf154403 n=1 Tax=Thermothielavioides terrestris TaxID=2587410 RepID=A0A446BJX7_9PEZI|nr:1ff2c0ca-34e3-40fb-903d-6a9bbf154403 [Thermothielavioides terrestris]
MSDDLTPGATKVAAKLGLQNAGQQKALAEVLKVLYFVPQELDVGSSLNFRNSLPQC